MMKEDEIIKVKEKYEQRLLSFPNVVGLGVGIKQMRNSPDGSQGISTNRLCLKIYVQKKVSKDKLRREEIIPQKIAGIETDVEEVATLKAQ